MAKRSQPALERRWLGARRKLKPFAHEDGPIGLEAKFRLEGDDPYFRERTGGAAIAGENGKHNRGRSPRQRHPWITSHPLNNAQRCGYKRSHRRANSRADARNTTHNIDSTSTCGQSSVTGASRQNTLM
jgi:hypothetical protein